MLHQGVEPIGYRVSEILTRREENDQWKPCCILPPVDATLFLWSLFFNLRLSDREHLKYCRTTYFHLVSCFGADLQCLDAPSRIPSSTSAPSVHTCIVIHTLHTTFRVSPLHYGFIWCKIVLCFELPLHCTSESDAPCLHTGISQHTVSVDWNFYSVSSNSKLSSPVNSVSFCSFMAAYEFREIYFWDDPYRFVTETDFSGSSNKSHRHVDFKVSSPTAACMKFPMSKH